MIHKILLNHIQGHDKLTLELSPRITSILGTNNSGKTTILRAVQWVNFNRPAVTVMKQRGADKCFAYLWTDRGEVTRFNDAHNGYKIVSKEGAIQLDRVGTTVPLQVKEVINLGDLNFQRTWDRQFFINKSETERYSYLMEKLGVNEITEAVKEITRRIATSKKELLALKEKKERLRILAFEKDELECICDMGDIIQEKLKVQDEICTAITRLIKLMRPLVDLQKDFEKIQEIPDYQELHEDLERMKSLFSRRGNYFDLYDDGMNTLRRLQNKGRDREAAKKEYAELLQELRSCPICAQTISDDLIKDILRDDEYLSIPLEDS